MIFAIWNSIQIPYSLAFTPEEDKSIYDTIVNLIIDLLFMSDVVINFRTSYIIDETGEEVASNK